MPDPTTIHAPIREKIVDDGDRFHIVREQDAAAIVRSLKRLPDMMSARKVAQAPRRLKAVIPNILAVQWAKDSGTQLYSKEWLAVVNKHLQDPNFRDLRVDLKGYTGQRASR